MQPEERGGGGSLGSLRNRKDIWDFVSFGPARRDESISDLIISQEDLGLLFVLIGKKGNLGFGPIKNISKTFNFDTNFTQKESGG